MWRTCSTVLISLYLIACICPVSVLFGERETRSGILVISETFDNRESAVKNLKLNLTVKCDVSDGVLKITDNTTSSTKFEIGDADWQDYEVEFRIKRLKLNPKDQHFGLTVRYDETSSLMLYCRGKSVTYLELAGKKAVRHTLLGNLPEEMETGENAKWYNFRVLVKGSEAKLYVDNVLIGTITSVVPRKGKISFYAYNLDILLDDF